MDSIARALDYHERTKHHLRRYARSLGYLDWDTQPDPFRRYEGAPVVELPLAADGLEARYDDLYRPGAVQPRPLGLEALGALFELGLGLSAWKQSGRSRWALRCNPSSGNLHPTEGYLITPPAAGLPAGIYHYQSHDHALERRAALDEEAAGVLAARLPAGAVLVGLSSIHWREAWKYGERAFRYCQHDVGHALASVRYAAAALGWSAVLLDDLGDARVAALLGLDREGDFAHLDAGDREHPDALLLVTPGPIAAGAVEALRAGIDEVIAAARRAAWGGRANALSPDHTRWEVIDEAAEATLRPPDQSTEGGGGVEEARPEVPPLAPLSRSARAAALIRKRRSAVSLDGRTGITADELYAMLDRLLPRPAIPPWDALPWVPRVHPVIFVHRVRGLEPGLYALARAPGAEARLRAAMHAELAWTRPPGCPAHLGLFLLAEADMRETAQIVSCHQDIAAEGALSLGMVADFGGPIRERGAWLYRRLFWEAGALGQVLYLEAEALETGDGPVRATGIGCYFDDVFHEVCGLGGDEFQSLYHFTMGGPVEDRRISTLPPYAHLGR